MEGGQIFQDEGQAGEWLVGKIQLEGLTVIGENRVDGSGVGIARRRTDVVEDVAAERTVGESDHPNRCDDPVIAVGYAQGRAEVKRRRSRRLTRWPSRHRCCPWGKSRDR